MTTTAESRSWSRRTGPTVTPASMNAIPRSKSFTGGFAQKFSSSGGRGSSEDDGGRRPTTPRTPVLGQGFRPGQRHAFGLNAGTKVPKNPRPARASAMFEVVAKGLRECIHVTEYDIGSLKSRVESLSVNSQQQLKLAERYVKRLEYQLTKVEELLDQYTLQMKLRDGVRSMAHAYILSPGKARESALSNVRCGFKECTEMLCTIEAHLQNMMGTLQLQMKGVQGFARLCVGDSFEISIKHGQQKWKTRGRVLKNNHQIWENPGVVFKALLGEVLHIKAAEAKGFTKAVLLGNKYCETKELFCPHPQVMTVNLNTSGSLKMNILITWNPLDGARDDISPIQNMNKSNTSPGFHHRSLPLQTNHGSISSCSVFSSVAESSDGSEHLMSPDGDEHSCSSSSHSSTSAHSSTVSTPDVGPMSDVVPDHSQLSNDPHAERIIRSKSMGVMNNLEGVTIRNIELQAYDSTKKVSNNVNARHSSDSNGNNVRQIYKINETESVKSNRRSTVGIPEVERNQPSVEKEPSYYRRFSENAVDRRTPVKSFSMDSMSSLLNGRSKINDGIVTVHVHLDQSSMPSVHKVDSFEYCSMDNGSSSLESHRESGALAEVVRITSSCLEDIQGRYPELQNLEQQITELEQIVQEASENRFGCYSSDISLAVESALECFDFLNMEMDADDLEYTENRISEGAKIVVDRDLTAKTSDSGIGSLARRLRRANSSSPECDPSPLPPSTGNEQLDLALCTHLSYCNRLLENLGSFGPLRFKETHAIEKIKQQSAVINRLLQLCNSVKDSKASKAPLSGSAELKKYSQLLQLWNPCTDRNPNIFCMSSKTLLPHLTVKCKHLLHEKHSDSATYLADKVSKLMISQALDSSKYEPESIITVFQFKNYFNKKHNGLDNFICQFAEEVVTVETLQSGSVVPITRIISSFTKNFPSVECLKVMSTLLASNSQLLVECTETYLRNVSSSPLLKKKVTEIFLEALESEQSFIRQGSCLALSRLQAIECIDQLAFLCHTDSSLEVQSSAKKALLSFGSEGRKAYEQTRLSSMGFNIKRGSIY